jgi:glucan phosphoethanolaminetransferase (alkaline phosphatase superfamily)
VPETIQGLPTHLLVIHAVVVLVPLCAAAVVVMVFSRLWRERLRWPLLILLTGALVSTYVAKQSGQWLQQRLASRGVSNAAITQHVDDGNKAIWFVLAFWVVVVVWLYLDARRPPAVTATRALGVVAAVVALVATGWIVVTGHAGSNAVWKGVVTVADVALR